MQPKYPIFIPSKGRWESRYTMKALDRIGVPYTVVIEPQERDAYAEVLTDLGRILVTPHRDKGLTVTRNFIWDYARDHNYPSYWTMDDNIKQFYRQNNNTNNPANSGAIFRVMEDFSERYVNVPVAGMQYHMFSVAKKGKLPFSINRRVYSNMLIRTDYRDPHGKPYRNQTYYNDDTDLCLRILKDGNCTLLFYAFLIRKETTMDVSGGMTPHYQGNGRWMMAEELRRAHPDVTKVVQKWGRWQHSVDYRPFLKNKLIRKPGLEIPAGENEYGMLLVQTEQPESATNAPNLNALQEAEHAGTT